MIYGIGTDIVLIKRIENLMARWGDKFPRRVLGPDELLEFKRRRAKPRHGEAYATRYLAKRFAAKEAFSKALGLGLRGPMTLLSLQILNDRRGKPVAYPRNALLPYCEELGLRWQVSVSDEVDSALAFVVIEQGPMPVAAAGAGTAAAVSISADAQRDAASAAPRVEKS